MQVDLAGQVALVTDASQGIGVVIAEAMAVGEHVIPTARRAREPELFANGERGPATTPAPHETVLRQPVTPVLRAVG